MKILHICSYYKTTSLYKKLSRAISQVNKEFYQLFYIPTNSKNDITQKIGSNGVSIEDTPQIKNIESNIKFTNLDRILYYTKQKKIMDDLESKINMSDFDIVHAHSLFVNGGIANKLNKKNDKKYIVAVRGTDINIFFKKLFFLRKTGINIMMGAEKIIFISPHLKNKFFENYAPSHCKKQLMQKCEIIPNGIDEFWFDDQEPKKLHRENTIRLIYIGKLNKDKNVEFIVDIFENLNDSGLNTQLKIIGDGTEREIIKKRINSSKHKVKMTFLPWINDKNELRTEYRNNDIFIMPSVNETLGITYLESISQGTPIIYTKNDGIDGSFNLKVGKAITPHNLEEGVKAIKEIMSEYTELSQDCIEESQKFKWNKIAEQYMRIYTKIGEN